MRVYAGVERAKSEREVKQDGVGGRPQQWFINLDTIPLVTFAIHVGAFYVW